MARKFWESATYRGGQPGWGDVSDRLETLFTGIALYSAAGVPPLPAWWDEVRDLQARYLDGVPHATRKPPRRTPDELFGQGH